MMLRPRALAIPRPAVSSLCTVGCALLLLLVFLTGSPSPVQEVDAQLTLGCEEVWAGPSGGNSFTDCLADQDRVKKFWPYYVYPGFAGLFFVLLLLLVPPLLCGCCCCARSCKKLCYPTDPAGHYNAQCCLWMWIAIAVLWSAAAVVAIVLGAHSAYFGFSDTLYTARFDVASYFNETATLITSFSTSAPAGIASASDMSLRVTSLVDDFDATYFHYMRSLAIVSYSVGTLPFVLIIFTLIFGFCEVHLCLPAAFAWIYWFVGMVFSLLALVVLVGAYFSSALCGELEQQSLRSPGVLQWLGVPSCERDFLADLQSMTRALEAQVSAESSAACNTLATYCDSSPIFTPPVGGGAGKFFFCATAPTCSAITTTALLQTLVDETPAKDPAFCLFTDPSLPTFPTCNAEACSFFCQLPGTVDSTGSFAAAQEIMTAVNQSRNATIALVASQSIGSCDLFGDAALWAFNFQLSNTINQHVHLATFEGSDVFPRASVSKEDHCWRIREGLWMCGTGYFIATLVFALGIYIMMRGRVVWGDFHDTTSKSDAVT